MHTCLLCDEIATERRMKRHTTYKPSMKAVVLFIVLVAALIGAGLLDSEALKAGWIE